MLSLLQRAKAMRASDRACECEHVRLLGASWDSCGSLAWDSHRLLLSTMHPTVHLVRGIHMQGAGFWIRNLQICEESLSVIGLRVEGLG